MATRKEADAAKEALFARFRGLGLHASVGLVKEGNAYRLKVNLETPPPPGVDVPSQIEGVPIEIAVTGPVRRR